MAPSKEKTAMAPWERPQGAPVERPYIDRPSISDLDAASCAPHGADSDQPGKLWLRAAVVLTAAAAAVREDPEWHPDEEPTPLIEAEGQSEPEFHEPQYEFWLAEPEWDARFDPNPETIRAEGLIADLLDWKLDPSDRPFPGDQLRPMSVLAPSVPDVKKTVKSERLVSVGADEKKKWTELAPPVPPTRPRLLSAKEVAQMRGCTPKHIYHLCITRQIPHSKFGHAVKFEQAEIAAWLDFHKIA
jgi:predicted DNA-binding transcriptional regulator AlpA